MDLIDDWVSIGVVTWNPAQTTNDLKAVKAKYGNKLVITGGFDTEGRLVEPDCTEEEVRQAVRDVIDALAPGGGYCFCGGFVAAVGDDVTARKNQIIMDEVYKYGSTFYGYDVSIRKGFPDGKGYTGGGFLTPGVVKEEPKEPVTV